MVCIAHIFRHIFAYCIGWGGFFFFTLDITVLNFALSLEHLENAFYTKALAQFDDQAFKDAGLAPWVRPRFLEIAAHEATHVADLSAALGANAVQPCTYSLYVFLEWSFRRELIYIFPD